MSAIITVTQYPSMPGRYKWAVKNGKKEYFGDVPDHGPEAAAAGAIDVAIRHGNGNYTILAPKNVLDCIPLEFKSQRR